MTSEQEASVGLTDLVQTATAIFFDQMQDRHERGQEKYGPIKFMEANTLIEAMEEVVDLANYAMYTYVKLYLLNESLQKNINLGDDAEGIGPNSFIPNSKR